ncbi:MAG: methyltransferase domain-containing protein [Chitinophagaceae bacterium]|nr:methyltransferase domain-containing protein [Chitinophagaceae bacterium]MBL0336770.1 methyltransferase domain-containing protein [Chitinophagaceae bacterium]
MDTQPKNREWKRYPQKDFGRRRSEICKARDFSMSWYLRWCAELREQPYFHRKQWEYVYVIQALWERHCIRPGMRGLAFAVGTEPLPSIFANYGCDILATDILPEKGIEKGWDNQDQLCLGIDSLNKRGLCKEEIFKNRVEYIPLDMNHIPSEIRNYDFNWSSCSFEHLGDMEKGFAFLKNQLKTLKPGGWAVHTTEYNLSSNDDTQDHNDTVIYRHRDIERIVTELRQEGHFVEETDYSLGNLPEDFQVDFQPHEQKVHLRLQVDQYITTSIGLIIRKKES